MTVVQTLATRVIISRIHREYLKHRFNAGDNPWLMPSADSFDVCGIENLYARARGYRQKKPIIDYCCFLEKLARRLFGFKNVTLRTRYLKELGLSDDEVARIRKTLTGYELPEIIIGGKGANKSMLEGFADYLELVIARRAMAHARSSVGV